MWIRKRTWWFTTSTAEKVTVQSSWRMGDKEFCTTKEIQRCNLLLKVCDLWALSKTCSHFFDFVATTYLRWNVYLAALHIESKHSEIIKATSEKRYDHAKASSGNSTAAHRGIMGNVFRLRTWTSAEYVSCWSTFGLLNRHMLLSMKVLLISND